MKVLDRLLGSDQYLRQPDFTEAPTVSIDFSGNKLRFKDPAHTALFPINEWPADMNIYNVDVYERLNSGKYAKKFYVKGWDLVGRFNNKRGGIIVSARIRFHKDAPDTYSSFDKSCFENDIFEYCQAVWGCRNKSGRSGEVGGTSYIYPTKSSELHYIEVNGAIWCGFEVNIPGKPPELNYFTPISSNHTLVLSMDFDPYKNLDFFSPETNIKEASYQVAENFLKYFHVELSEESKAQQASVKNGLTA